MICIVAYSKICVLPLRAVSFVHVYEFRPLTCHYINSLLPTNPPPQFSRLGSQGPLHYTFVLSIYIAIHVHAVGVPGKNNFLGCVCSANASRERRVLVSTSVCTCTCVGIYMTSHKQTAPVLKCSLLYTLVLSMHIPCSSVHVYTCVSFWEKNLLFVGGVWGEVWGRERTGVVVHVAALQ